MVAVLLLMQRRFAAHSYRQLIPQLLVGGLIYGICLIWAYMTDRALHVGDLGPLREDVLSDVTPITTGENYQEDI
jgi:hypothetical protein